MARLKICNHATPNYCNRRNSLNRGIQLYDTSGHPREKRHESNPFPRTRAFIMLSCLHWSIFPSFISFLERHFPPSTFHNKKIYISLQWELPQLLTAAGKTYKWLPPVSLVYHQSAFPFALAQGQWSLLKLPDLNQPALILLTVQLQEKKTALLKQRVGGLLV